MRVRRFELRLLAAILTAGWLAAAGLVLIGYRPGGPGDLVVGLAALPAAMIAAAALAWPPIARSDRAFGLIVWLGIGALLLLAPSIGGLVEQLRLGGPQTLLPSLEAAYPWLLALAGTAVFTGFGIARRTLGESALRRDRLGIGLLLGATMTMAAAALFAGAAIANDIALRESPPASSRFGPTDPSLEPPACDGPLASGTSAVLGETLSGVVDARSIGSARLSGTRAGTDFRWNAAVATTLTLGREGAASVGGLGWVLDQGGAWISVPPVVVADDSVDLQVLATALTPGNRATAESLGIATVEGARARECKVAIDGPTFRTAFPQVEWLVGAADISRWRGDVRYWVFGDGQLGQVIATANGEGADMTPKGVLGTVTVSLTATDRDAAIAVEPPD